MPLRLLSKIRKNDPAPETKRRRTPRPAPERPAYEPAETITLEQDELLRHLQLERFGAILAKASKWQAHACIDKALQTARQAIDDRFSLVPEGFAAVLQSIYDDPGHDELDVQTEPFLLALHAVTQAEYQHFVDDGGYNELSYWPQDIWPHLIDFIDRTGKQAPRFWQNGRHDKALSDHPIVGICYYEAAAYAQWAGFRLPTEAEWQMAASWRIRSSANVLRRYPWGDALDKSKCNIWASCIGKTVPVSAYESGAAPNGVKQLVGNVWEWTASPFEVADDNGRPILGDMLMMSIRGGAYDSYFPAQATSCFRTGLACMLRQHNVGFRCATDLGKGH